MENNTEHEDALNTKEEETSKNDTDETNDEQSVEELKEKLVKETERADNQKIRAEKAEKANKKEPETKKVEKETPKNDDYSLQDIRALAEVHDEDVDRIVKFSKMEGISIPEAMKNTDMQAILKNRAEERKTAEASNTGGGKRGSSKVSGTKILRDAEESGKMPETDAGMEALVDERYKPSA